MSNSRRPRPLEPLRWAAAAARSSRPTEGSLPSRIAQPIFLRCEPAGADPGSTTFVNLFPDRGTRSEPFSAYETDIAAWTARRRESGQMFSLKGRSFLTLLDFEESEIHGILDLAHRLKASGPSDRLKNKNLVLLFEKRSTRTRCAFEIAMRSEGGHVTYLDKDSSQFSKKESVEDSAKILGSYYDAIEYRGYDQSVPEELAKHSGVPVYNGLTDTDHPTQILADLMTIQEHVRKPLREVKIAFVGDIRNNMAIAWMYGCAKMGMHYVGYGPKELSPDPQVTRLVEGLCQKSGGSVKITDSSADLVGCDVIYTDVWVSMGEEDKLRERVALLSPFRVTMDLLSKTKNPQVKFMHCLPAFHDFETEVARKAMTEMNLDVREVTDEVFRSEHSIAFPEAVNRIHTIRAVIVSTLT